MSTPFLRSADTISGFIDAVRAAASYTVASARRWILPALALAAVQLVAGGVIGAWLSGLLLSTPMADPITLTFSSLLFATLVGGFGAFVFGVWFTGMTLDRGAPASVSLARRVLAYLAASLLVSIASFILTVPISVALTSCGLAGACSAESIVSGAGLVLLLLIPIVIYLSIRLSAIGPASIALGRPIEAIRRSWAISRGHVWMLFFWLLGFGLVTALVSLGLSMAVTLVVAIVAGPLGANAFGVSAIASTVTSLLVTPLALSLQVVLYERLMLEAAPR